MAEIVDSIIAELEVRLGNYVTNFNQASDAHERFNRTRPDKAGQFSTAEIQQYSNRHKQAAGEVAGAEEAATARVVRTRKARTAEEIAAAEAVKKAARETAAAERASAKAAADAIKAAEREKQAALTATVRAQEKAAAAAQAKAVAEREAAAAAVAAVEREAAARVRLAAVVERGVGRSTIAPGRGGVIGAEVPRGTSGQRGIPAAVLAGSATEEVAVEKEVNHLLADQATMRAGLVTLSKADQRAVQDKLGALRLEGQLRKAGIAEEEILLRLEERETALARKRAADASQSKRAGVGRFAEAAGLGRTGGGGAAVAGIAVAAGFAITVEAIGSAVAYAKELRNVSEQIGLTTKQTQVYQAAASRAGVSTEQFRSGLGQLANNLGKAQTGGVQEAKIFAALGVDIKSATSAGELLPTLIDRISSIADPAKRAAVETRLFGEQGRKLDSLLSGGNQRVNELADALQRTGAILSDGDIQRLGEIEKKLAGVKAQLQADLAQVVAGNASAIIGLANAFAVLANAALKADSAMTRIRQLSLVDSGRSFSAKFGADLIGTAVGAAQGKNRAQISDENIATLIGGSTADRSALLRKTAQETREAGANGDTAQVARLRARQQAILKAEQQSHQVDAQPQAGRVNTGLLNKINAPKPPKGPKGKSPDEIEADRLERDKRFTEQERQQQVERLSLLANITADTRTQDEYERQRIRTERDARDREYADAAESTIKRQKLKGNDADLERARARTITLLNDNNAELSLRGVNFRELARYAQEETASAKAANDIQLEINNNALALARSSGQRRRLSEANLAITQAQEQRDLEWTRDDITKSQEERDRAKDRLTQLPTIQRGQQQVLANENRTEGQRYRDELPRTAGQIKDSLESIETNGLRSLDDQLTSTISKVVNLGGAFGGVANKIIADLIRIGVERSIIGPLADGLFGKGESGHSLGGSTGGGAGGFFGKLLSLAGSTFGHRAAGGDTVAGVPYLVGEHGPEMRVFGQSGKIYPNNTAVASGAPRVTIVAPQHYDLSGVVMTEDLVKGLRADNRAYANKVAAHAAGAAVEAAPGRVSRMQTLGS